MKYIIKFCLCEKPLSKNKGTRTRAQCSNYLLQNFADQCISFTHNQCLSKGLKKIEEESSCEIQVSDEIKIVSF